MLQVHDVGPVVLMPGPLLEVIRVRVMPASHGGEGPSARAVVGPRGTEPDGGTPATRTASGTPPPPPSGPQSSSLTYFEILLVTLEYFAEPSSTYCVKFNLKSLLLVP